MPAHRSPPPPIPAPASPQAAPTLGDVVARVGAEVSAPLTAALERVLTLASTGRIDRHGLQSLRQEIEGARRAGLRGQQIARLAGGHVRQSVERLELPQALREVLQGQPVHANGTAIACPPPPIKAEVLADASLLHAVLDAAAAWSAPLARANVDWRIEVQPWPVRARVVCRFAHLPIDQADTGVPAGASPQRAPGHHEGSLDTLDWLLLSYTAHLAGVLVNRHDSASHSVLTLEFLNTVNGTLEGAAAVDLVASANGASRSLAGCDVLVVAAQRSTRQRVREALQGQDLTVDFVSTIADASFYCNDGPPNLLLHESAFNGDALVSLRRRLAGRRPGTAVIEILPTGQSCEMSEPEEEPVTRLGLDALRNMLLPVMVLELGRTNGG